MRTYLDCIPCFLRQALEAARMAGADEITQKRILNEVAKTIPALKLESTPPEMGEVIHRLVKRMTGKEDPYKELKEKGTRQALKIYPKLKEKVKAADDKLLMAVELAIAGNIIDYGTKNSLNVDKELEKILQKERESIKDENTFIFNFSDFKESLKNAKDILYLGDNAGETVFDRILLEEIERIYPEKEIIYAVKEKPIINDALKKDAIASGIGEIAKIVSSGSVVPGTILSLCSENFRRTFDEADMIISKGQGNYETLSDEKRPIYFLFMAKCPVIARDVGCNVGEIILFCNHNSSSGEN